MLRSGAYSEVVARDAFRSLEAVMLAEEAAMRRCGGGGVHRRTGCSARALHGRGYAEAARYAQGEKIISTDIMQSNKFMTSCSRSAGFERAPMA